MAKKRRKKKSGTGGLKTIIFAAVVTFAIGLFLFIKYGDRLTGPTTGPVPSKPASMQVKLYLSDEEGLMLKALTGSVKSGTTEQEIKEAIGRLIDDPSSTIPQGTRLLGVRIDKEVAFVDFSAEIVKNHPGGSSGETQTIYSIVDTVTLNFSNIKEVQILVEGKKEQTLAGHIDISMPLGPDTDIITD